MSKDLRVSYGSDDTSNPSVNSELNAKMSSEVRDLNSYMVVNARTPSI